MQSFRQQRKEDPAFTAWSLSLSRDNSSGVEWSLPEVVSSLGSSCDSMAPSAKAIFTHLWSCSAKQESREELLYPLLPTLSDAAKVITLQ